MRAVFCVALILAAISALLNNGAVVRWTEGVQGCTFSADDDGLYRYGLWKDDYGIVMAVDADETRKATHRTEPTFAVLLTFRYRGKEAMEVDPKGISLEFVKHDHDVQAAIAPEVLTASLRRDADRVSEEMKREAGKHADRATDRLVSLVGEQKSIAETIDFLKANSLGRGRLDANRPELSGWVFFNAKSRWIGDWKKQEEFVLRVPLAGETIEFPFALPPSQGDFILRRRQKDKPEGTQGHSVSGEGGTIPEGI